MKRLVTFTLFGLLLLSACRRAGSLLPDDVLRRSTAASAQMQSVEFDATLDATFTSPRLSGRAELRGTLARGGQEAAFSLSLNGSSIQRVGKADTRTNLQLVADVVSEADAVYVLLHTLSVDPEVPALRGAQSMLGKWWKAPRDGSGLGPSLTPDPQFLRAQAAVVRVQRDMGLERINGRDAYHYAVTLDPEALIALMASTAEKKGTPFNAAQARTELQQYDVNGELWIDAESFLLHRLRWTVDSRPPALHIEFGADLRKHNAAAGVVIPSAAEPLDAAAFLQMLSLPVLPLTP